MSHVQIAINGEPLFTWDGDTKEIDSIERRLKKLARRKAPRPKRWHRLTTPTDFEMAAIIYTIARQPTGHPRFPGAFRDYLPVWDFSFDLSASWSGDGLEVEVIGEPQPAGLA